MVIAEADLVVLCVYLVQDRLRALQALMQQVRKRPICVYS
jgi:hypothetical protein